MIPRIVDCSVENFVEVLRSRKAVVNRAVIEAVAAIIDDVRLHGDEALLRLGRRFDSPHLSSIEATDEELSVHLEERFEEAIEESIRRVATFHEEQLRAFSGGLEQDGRRFAWSNTTEHGGQIGQRWIPVQSVGVYAPGGKASYPSSVIMNGIPAMVSGVSSLILTTPPDAHGLLHPAVAYAARRCEVDRVFKVGGAGAVAALALGTESVPRVDKIVGPGNAFVNEAKRQLWGEVGLDGFAGPSEVCVLADDTANEAYAAADLLTQIEHSEDNAGFLVTLSLDKAHRILAEADRQATGVPRESILRKALAEYGMAFVARDLAEACDVVNAIAPEHLSVAVGDPDAVLKRIKNAGCVLLGEFTPESAGDFAVGPSHTLPTSGSARFASPVNVLDFFKIQSVVKLEQGDLAQIAPTIAAFAELEGFPAHGRGTTVRFE